MTKVSLDRFVNRDRIDREFVERKFYSYKDECIKLNAQDKEKFEKMLQETYKDNSLFFVEAVSKKNNHTGYQDVVIIFDTLGR